MPAAAPARLKKRREFLRVGGQRRRWVTAGLVLQGAARGDQSPPRLGFTVTRKIGGAVVRNRARRRLREAASQAFGRLASQGQVPAGWDFVVVARDGALTRGFADLVEDIARGARWLTKDRPPADADDRERDRGSDDAGQA